MEQSRIMNLSFTSKLLVSNWNKSGIPRLRVSVKTRDYEFISYRGEVKHLHKMVLKRTNGEIVTMDYARISKGTKQGKYTPHYITVSADDVKKYDFKPNEAVSVYVEWFDVSDKP